MKTSRCLGVDPADASIQVVTGDMIAAGAARPVPIGDKRRGDVGRSIGSPGNGLRALSGPVLTTADEAVRMMRQRQRRQDDIWRSRDPDDWWVGGECDDNGKYTRPL